MAIDLIHHPSPNHDERDQPVSMLVLHYTGMPTGQEALGRLCNPEAKVSAHYLVEQDGRIFHLVPEDRRAWHAGVGRWGDIDNVNAASIGIEIVNKGHLWGYEEFPAPQVHALLELVEGILSRHSILPRHVVGHSDIAPTRKDDPGEKFPWTLFAEKGWALPLYTGEVSAQPPAYEDSINLLQQIGYKVTLKEPIAAVLAFQRRFVPNEMGQGLNPRTRTAIKWVADLIPSST